MPAKQLQQQRLYLNKVHLKGFKSIEDLSISFENGLNILIGKNGSGKSNFMDFLYEALRTTRKSNILYNYAKIDFISDDEHNYEIEFEKVIKRKFNGSDNVEDRLQLIEKVTIDDNVLFLNSKDLEYKKQIVINNFAASYMGNFRTMFIRLGYRSIFPLFLKFNLPDSLDCLNVPGEIKADLDGFYTWKYPNSLSFIDDLLFNLERTYGEDNDKIKVLTAAEVLKLLKIEGELKDNLKLFTNIENIRFNPNINVYHTEKSVIIDNIKIEFKINSNWLPWSQLSDGTKRLFCIVAEVTHSEGIVLIEEPELGVHPHQFNLLMDFLKEQSADKQIVISTHSPKALDHLSPNEFGNIIIADYDLKKGTQMRHLTAAEMKKAAKYMKEVGFFSDYWMLSDLE